MSEAEALLTAFGFVVAAFVMWIVGSWFSEILDEEDLFP